MLEILRTENDNNLIISFFSFDFLYFNYHCIGATPEIHKIQNKNTFASRIN